VFRRFPSQHGDFIHDMSFDFYGKRLATCSSDRKIKVWEERGDEWRLEHEWNAHQASVWKVAWAHPEFGQILASCSFDRTVSVWEDQGVYVHSGGANGGGGAAAAPTVGGGGGGSAASPPVSGGAANGAGPAAHHAAGVKEGWRNQAQLVDARESVHDVKFAPRHLGLRLVRVCPVSEGDGVVD
jgi:nucleoporin SEH1